MIDAYRLLKGSPILHTSNRADQHPSEPSAVYDLPFCDVPLRAPGRGAPFVRPEAVGAWPEPHGGVVSRKQSAHALPLANWGRPSCDRKGSASPRISILPAIAHAPPSCRQGCGPCRQASSVRSIARRENGNACCRVPANFGTGCPIFADIPLVGLRGPHDIARHRFAVFGRCSVGLFASALWARVLQLRP